MGMHDSIDRLVDLCDDVIESDPPGLRQNLADLRFAAEEKTREASPGRQRTRSTLHPRTLGSSPHSPAPSAHSQSCSEPGQAATNQIVGKLKALSVI